MDVVPGTLSNTFQKFVESEKSGGLLLILCTIVSLWITNSSDGTDYLRMWNTQVGGLTLQHWINDALMAIFFLLIGLELERELYSGELSNIRNALLPIVAAIGGIVAPALIHFGLNAGTPTQAGIGIPTATDIAFALGVLALLGNRIPSSLKVFIVAFAVIDDLSAIVIIAAFYTAHLSVGYLAGALGVWALLFAMNRLFRIVTLLPYLLGGVVMWFLMLKSGVHTTVTGVMLAFAIPFSIKVDDQESPSHKLERFLHKPVAFMILPIFALANTAVSVSTDWLHELGSANSVGIIAGLIVGKPLGIVFFSFVAVWGGMCRLPFDLTWSHVVGAGFLGGLGFTMSIFITNLAFSGNLETINASRMAILLGSLAAGVVGFIWLALLSKSEATAAA